MKLINNMLCERDKDMENFEIFWYKYRIREQIFLR